MPPVTPKQGPEVEKTNPQFPSRKNPIHNSIAIYKPPRHALESSKESAIEPDLVPFRISIDYVFNTIKDQP